MQFDTNTSQEKPPNRDQRGKNDLQIPVCSCNQHFSQDTYTPYGTCFIPVWTNDVGMF